jgi:hypothetical protein
VVLNGAVLAELDKATVSVEEADWDSELILRMCKSAAFTVGAGYLVKNGFAHSGFHQALL